MKLVFQETSFSKKQVQIEEAAIVQRLKNIFPAADVSIIQTVVQW